MDMQKIKEFEDKVNQAFFFACRYGLYTYKQENSNENKIDHHRFHILCNTGFKIAQSIIFKELRLLQTERKELQEKLKSIRKENKDDRLTKEEIEFNHYKDDIFRLLGFSLVWQMFNGKSEYISKFYIEAEGDKDLNSKSFEAVIAEANIINEEPNNFCFISDLASNIQIGDLLIKTPNRIEIKEIKTGKKNEVALNLLEFYRHNTIELDEKRMSKSFDKTFIDQLKRIKSQEERRKRVDEIIIKDQGKDTKTGEIDSFLITPSYYNQKYHDVLYEMIEKSKQEGFAYDHIEGILNIGVYRNDWRNFGEGILTQLNNQYPVFNLMQARGVTICEPIFMKPFNDDTVMDLVMGRLQILIGVDYNAFINFCNLLGMNARWSTTKEFQKMFEQIPMKSKELFSYQNRGVIIEDDGQKENFAFMGQGIFGRIIFDHIYPSSIILNRLGIFDNLRDKLRGDIII